MGYQGSCHCGEVTFTVDTPLPEEALSCTCSHCRAKGFLLTFVATDQFHLTKGEEKLQTYRFNTKRIAHQFCTLCGTEAFALGIGPDGSEMRAINLRCVPEVDLNTLKLQHFDGTKI